MAACKRLHTELRELRQMYIDACSNVELVDENIHQWKATLIGPPDSPYENGRFELSLKFPNNYPYKPPEVQFLTPIFHPNVSYDGLICLDILDSNWSAAYTVSKLLVAIRSLICDPYASSALNGEAGKLYHTNREAFNTRARQMTEQYAKDKEGTDQVQKSVTIQVQNPAAGQVQNTGARQVQNTPARQVQNPAARQVQNPATRQVQNPVAAKQRLTPDIRQAQYELARLDNRPNGSTFNQISFANHTFNNENRSTPNSRNSQSNQNRTIPRTTQRTVRTTERTTVSGVVSVTTHNSFTGGTRTVTTHTVNGNTTQVSITETRGCCIS